MLAPLVGLAFLLLYLSTLAHTLDADAAAYVELAARGDLHPQHLLQHKLGGLLLDLAAALAPELAPALALAGLNALGGAVGLGLVVRLAQRLGAGPGPSLGAAAVLGTSFGWWSLSTTAEVHVLAVTAALLAFLLAPAHPRAAGLLLGLGVLLHKTMLLGLPGLLLAVGRRAPVALLAALAPVALGYGAVVLGEVRLGVPLSDALRAWGLAEVAQPWPGSQGPSRVAAAVVGLSTVWLYRGPPRCIAFLDELGLPHPPPAGGLSWTLVQLLLPLLAGLVLLGLRRLDPARWPLGQGLLAWAGLCSLAAFAFEPFNHEYYLGAFAALLALGAAGADAPGEGRPWARHLLLPGALLVAGYALAFNHRQAIGPATLPADRVSVCPRGPR